jgi:ferritin-like metal-binding protein YciE
MSTGIDKQLTDGLVRAHALEKQAIRMLEAAETIAGDDEIAAVYRAHLLQTREHERYVAERLQRRGASPSTVRDTAMEAGALGLGALLRAMPDTPVRLATTAYAFESLEVATYRLLRSLAERAGDEETARVVGRILEQEEAAAELVAGTFDRALEVTLGQPPESPLTPVTPIGRPSERTGDQPHAGPQEPRRAS